MPQNRKKQVGADGRFLPGQSGNPGGRPAGIRAFREKFGPNLETYGQCLHDLAVTENKQQLEALRLMHAYLIGPPNALSEHEETELDKLTPEELKQELKRTLRLVEAETR